MKKLQNLSELQKIGALSVALASIGYASIVALFAHYADLLATMTLCGLLVTFGAITCGVIVSMMKDEQLARAVRGSRYTLNAITAERDELSDKLESALADLRDERSRVRVLSAQVMSDTEQLESVTSGYRALNTENADNARHIGALRDRVRTLSAQVSDLQEENALTASELADSEHRENIATADLKRAREIGENLNNIHREQVARIAELTERIEVLQESRADWRTAYDKLRNGKAEYTASASTAFALGTLDRAYEVDGETRYPVK